MYFVGLLLRAAGVHVRMCARGDNRNAEDICNYTLLKGWLFSIQERIRDTVAAAGAHTYGSSSRLNMQPQCVGGTAASRARLQHYQRQAQQERRDSGKDGDTVSALRGFNTVPSPFDSSLPVVTRMFLPSIPCLSMRVKLLLFAGAREVAHASRIEVDLSDLLDRCSRTKSPSCSFERDSEDGVRAPCGQENPATFSAGRVAKCERATDETQAVPSAQASTTVGARAKAAVRHHLVATTGTCAKDEGTHVVHEGVETSQERRKPHSEAVHYGCNTHMEWSPPSACVTEDSGWHTRHSVASAATQPAGRGDVIREDAPELDHVNESRQRKSRGADTVKQPAHCCRGHAEAAGVPGDENCYYSTSYRSDTEALTHEKSCSLGQQAATAAAAASPRQHSANYPTTSAGEQKVERGTVSSRNWRTPPGETHDGKGRRRLVTSVANFLACVRQQHPVLRDILPSCALARNCFVVTHDEELCIDSDTELALLPPVSGG